MQFYLHLLINIVGINLVVALWLHTQTETILTTSRHVFCCEEHGHSVTSKHNMYCFCIRELHFRL